MILQRVPCLYDHLNKYFKCCNLNDYSRSSIRTVVKKFKCGSENIIINMLKNEF